MELDSYWRTRTIAEAQSQRYTHFARHLSRLREHHRYSVADVAFATPSRPSLAKYKYDGAIRGAARQSRALYNPGAP